MSLNPFDDRYEEDSFDHENDQLLSGEMNSTKKSNIRLNKHNKVISNRGFEDLKFEQIHKENAGSSGSGSNFEDFDDDDLDETMNEDKLMIKRGKAKTMKNGDHSYGEDSVAGTTVDGGGGDGGGGSDSDDDDDPIRFNGSEFVDDFGNKYEHMNFNFKEYTKKLKFKGNRLVYFTSAFVSLFVSLFGYEQGVCSGILTFVTFDAYFDHPSATEIGLIISILEIGAMISSLFVAKLSDKFGRKKTILIGTFVFMIGGCLQSFAVNLYVFSVGRVLSGFGVGILSTIVPSYQCEISPSEDRGKLVCGEFSGNISGYALSVWVDYFCYFIQDRGDARDNPHSFAANLSWRLPLFVQVVIAFVLFLGGFFIVESPRFLLDVDDDQRGFNILSLLYESSPEHNKPIKEFFLIKNSILNERVLIPKYERSWKNMFKNYLLRVLIACSSFAFAQFNGINIISYYAPMVFEEAGFNNSKALLMTGINAIVYLLSTIPPWFLVDRWGRKPILVSGAVSMAICLYLIAIIMALDKPFTPNMVALLVVIYNASFGYSWGPIGFLIPPEVYPLAIRSKGVSIATATNWLANYIVGQLTPIFQETIGWGLYIFPATSCVISIVVVLLFYPETKGVELEDIDRVFDEFYNTSGKKPKMNEYIMVQETNNANQRSDNDLELDELDYETDFQRREVL